jgi:hypothetical protein
MNNQNDRLKNVLKSRRFALRMNAWEKLHNSKFSAPSWWEHTDYKVGKCSKRGRYVYTTKDIEKGDIIFEETPLKGTYKEIIKIVNENIKCAELDGGQENCIEKNAFSEMTSKKIYLIYLHGSIFSHSCTPNIKLSNNKFKAIKKINAGEELCISYLGENLSKWSYEKRKKELLTWFPSCGCTICSV